MGRKTILLAEDDPQHAALVCRAVEGAAAGCRLDVVASGLEALDYLFARGAHAARDPRHMPSLILLDLRMPEMDGLQVLQALRRTCHREELGLPPVVVLSVSDREEDVADAYRFGAFSYVRKPADYAALVQVIRQITLYWLGLNEPPPSRRTAAAT